MSKFQKGDLVQIVETEHRGAVTSVEAVCGCVAVAIFGSPYYRLTGFTDNCFRESALKKIDGERPAETITETRDEPVAA